MTDDAQIDEAQARLIQQELAKDHAREFLQRVENVAEALLLKWEDQLGRPLAPTERSEMMAWLKASAAVPPT